MVTQQAGIVSLPAGLHQLQIKAININQAELMKLPEVQLIPVTNKNIK